MFKLGLKLSAIIVFALSSLAHAGSYNFDKTYVSGSIGSSGMGDESSMGYTVIVGTGYDYDISLLKDKDTRVEVGYLKTTASTETVGSTKFETTASAFFAMQRLNVAITPEIDLVGKIGFTSGKISVDTTGGLSTVESEVSKYSLTYAVGGEYNFSSQLSAGATFTRYTADIDSFDATISYKF